MKPIVETIYLDSRLSGVGALVEVICCNHKQEVSLSDFQDKWTCPVCGQTLQFHFGEVTYTIIGEGE